MRERLAAEIDEAKPGEVKPGMDKWDQISPWSHMYGAGVTRSYVRTIRRCE
jgi:hypothetical protein